MYERGKLICEQLLLIASEIDNDYITDKLFDISAEVMIMAKEIDGKENELEGQQEESRKKDRGREETTDNAEG